MADFTWLYGMWNMLLESRAAIRKIRNNYNRTDNETAGDVSCGFACYGIVGGNNMQEKEVSGSSESLCP